MWSRERPADALGRLRAVGTTGFRKPGARGGLVSSPDGSDASGPAGGAKRPAVDINQTTSSLLTPEIVGDRHYLLSVQVQELLQKYESLKSIIAIIGENELSEVDRADYAKAKRLIANFTQNLHVMKKHSGAEGEYFTREQTLQSVEEIIA